MSFFFTLASNYCDSRIPRESLRFSICLESWSSCRLNSAIERSLGGMLDTAPPRPGVSLKRNSPDLSPARVDKRSPSASRRMSWACIWPSFTAIAFRFSRRNSSVLRRWASCADKTSESSSGSLNSVAWRTVIQKSASVRLNRRSAMSMAPATRCRLVRVQDLDLANLLETRIICMLPPPGGALYTSYAYAYEEPLRLLESVRRHRSPDAAAVLPESLARCCSIANFKQGKVVIFAANGAIAAKLKLMLPTLSEQLSKRGIEVTGLEVCVQPLASDPQVVEKSAKMSAQAASGLARLSEQLPDSELKTTLVKFAARHRK